MSPIGMMMGMMIHILRFSSFKSLCVRLGQLVLFFSYRCLSRVQACCRGGAHENYMHSLPAAISSVDSLPRKPVVLLVFIVTKVVGRAFWGLSPVLAFE